MALAERGITQKTKYSPETINQELIKGRTREDLAKEFGHKDYKAIDMYMRRKGYRWDNEKQIYVVRGEKKEKTKKAEPKRVNMVLILFDEGKDPRQIAKELGFKDHHALSEFMKEKNYIFNPDIQNYELQADVIEDEDDADDEDGKANTSINTNNLNQEDAEALQLVMENKDKLKELLEMADSTTTLPRYSLSGIRISKTIQFSKDLNDMVKEFSEDKGINQREFFEMAAIEFLKKYGYSAEVKGLLG